MSIFSHVHFAEMHPRQGFAIASYVNYLLYTIDEVYEEFENRFAKSGQKRGEKTWSVESVLNDTEGKFTLRDIEWKCPGVSKETIRSVSKAHPDCFVCEGRGVAARWLKIKNLACVI